MDNQGTLVKLVPGETVRNTRPVQYARDMPQKGNFFASEELAVNEAAIFIVLSEYYAVYKRHWQAFLMDGKLVWVPLNARFWGQTIQPDWTEYFEPVSP